MIAVLDLNLRHLRALPVILQKRAVGGAAEVVGFSQPALTQGLSKLETALGTALFERLPNGMVPMPEGRALADRVEVAFEHLAQAARTGGRRFARPERLMTATQLKAFLALADAGSFVAAAVSTGLSQPAIHRSTRDLEQAMGIALVERRGRGIALTVSGRRLARGIRLFVAELAAGLAEINVGDAGAATIAIGAMPLSRALILPNALSRFLAETRAASIRIVEGSWRELVEPLRDGVIDMMIGAVRPFDLPDLEQVPLHETRLSIIAGAHHPLAGPKPVPLEELAAFPWIVGPSGAPLRSRWEELFAGAGPPPLNPIECGSVMTIRGLLAKTDHLTLLSHEQVAVEVAIGLLAHVGPPLPHGVRRVGVTTRRGWRPSPIHRLFLDHLTACAGELGIQLSE
jgi:LysR family transcriptional regulator, regulator for genes of the gallate degradation pathway